ncbi:KRAB-A domain-containing 2-like [Brachionus plicatilis]|uniref:KRAB-A domain-containing 2-like n=1 Tax=Brachionus plicatilis TaxID=10195 RepID=A0A3M7QR65_BRAPC|nr:KRAB-A domain-containing 2-like [Brachionus plicatilis]
MVSIQNIPINFASISDEIESKELVHALVKVLSLNKTSCELKNLFNFLFEGFKKNIFKFQDTSFYSQWLKLMVWSVIILTSEGRNSEFILLNLIQFLKALINKENDFDRKIQSEIYIETLLNLMKLSFFQDDSISKEILRDLVLFRTDDVDRGMAGAQNILYIILEVKNDLFKLGCRAGVLDTFEACNCIEKTNLVTEFNQEFIPKDKQGDFIKVSAREAVRLVSVGHGQGFLKCSCTGECATMRCSCCKAELKCSSKCHAKMFQCKNCDYNVNLIDFK